MGIEGAGPSREANGQGSTMERLTGYIGKAQTMDLPEPVVQRAKHHILDTFAAMVSGSSLKPGRLAIAYAGQQGGPPEAQVVASRLKVSAVNAALANGMLGHADETDDTYSLGGLHPGCIMVPAALAMAERENADGASFLRAVVLGYDVGCRTNRALGGRSAIRARNHLSFGLGGTMGAAAAAGSLAKLGPEQISYLLSFAAQQASGIKTFARDTEHIEKAFTFGGMAARNGVAAATMVQSGFTGVADVFSGDGNFFSAYADKPDPGEMVAELGSRFDVMHTNIKKYCVGFHIQLPLEGLLLIMKEHRIGAPDVERVVARVEESGARTVNDRAMSDINLQYILAVTLLDGDLSSEAAHSRERMQDPDVLVLKNRITVLPDPQMSSFWPNSNSVVEVTTRDGRTFRQQVHTFSGNVDKPLSTAEVEKKAAELLEPVLGTGRPRRLMDMVGRLEKLPSVRELQPLLAGC